MEHVPPWLRRLAAIGADLEGKLHRFEKSASHRSELGHEFNGKNFGSSNSFNADGDEVSNQGGASAGTSNNSGVSATGALGLRLLFEEEFSDLAEEALRRAAVKRHHDRYSAAAAQDDGQETDSSLAVASADALTIDCNLPRNPIWDTEAAAAAKRSLQHRRQESRMDYQSEVASSDSGKATALPSTASEKNASRAAQDGGLRALYEGCGGTTWVNRHGWGTESECGRWFGVSCDPASKDVIELRLGSNHLEGALPIQVGPFSGVV